MDTCDLCGGRCDRPLHDHVRHDKEVILMDRNEYRRRWFKEMVTYAGLVEADEDGWKKLKAHADEFDRVVLHENDQCQHTDGDAECWHYGGREGADG